MSFFSQMGLQKRMVLLILFFLGGTFGLFAYLGLQAVHRSTELIFNERLALAESIAAQVDSAITYATLELEKMASFATLDLLAYPQGPETSGGCLTMCHARAEVPVSRVGIADRTGRLLSLEPHALEPSGDWEGPLPAVREALEQGQTAVAEVAGRGAGSGPLVSLATPFRDHTGAIIGALTMELEPWRNIAALNPLSQEWKQSYHFELINERGLLLAGAGPDEIAGQISRHLEMVAPLMEQRQAAARIHHVPEQTGAKDHVIAFAPLNEMTWGVIVEQENDTALAVPNGLRRNLLLFGGAAFVMAIVLVWVITRRVVKPVKELTLASQKIAAGDLEQPVVVRGKDEVGQLSRSFDEMRVQLKAAQGEQARLVETLQEQDRLKTEFVARASHELRTPLTSIKSLAETLLREDLELPPGEQREFLQGINEASDRLANIVTELLTVSRIEAGQIEVRREAVPLSPLIRRVVGGLGAEAAGQVSYLEAAPKLPPAWADAEKLEAVVANLLSNALKYSPPEEPITVVAAADSSGPWVVVSVADRGPGIPATEMGKLFQRFSRVESPTTQGVRGVGLGLYICKSYVEAMGGSIWAHSTPGRGSTFSFRLPVAGAESVGRGKARQKAHPRPKAPRPTLKGRVLVVDDEADVRRTAQLNLDSYGLETSTAATGQECLELARAHPPDVIVLDIVMPGMDGLEVARRLKEGETTRHIPIIFLSAKTQEEDQARGYQVGASAYITKPFSPSELGRVVASVLDQRPSARRSRPGRKATGP